MQFQQATIQLFHDEGRLGSDLNLKNPSVGKVITWRDQEQIWIFLKGQGICGRVSNFWKKFCLWQGTVLLYGWTQFVYRSRRSIARAHPRCDIHLAGRLRKQDFVIS